MQNPNSFNYDNKQNFDCFFPGKLTCLRSTSYVFRSLIHSLNKNKHLLFSAVKRKCSQKTHSHPCHFPFFFHRYIIMQFINISRVSSSVSWCARSDFQVPVEKGKETKRMAVFFSFFFVGLDQKIPKKITTVIINL